VSGERPRIDGGIEACHVTVSEAPILGLLLPLPGAVVQQLDLCSGERYLGEPGTGELVQRVAGQPVPMETGRRPGSRFDLGSPWEAEKEVVQNRYR
jgi:hypothetical protein